jgi:hypothetical protein
VLLNPRLEPLPIWLVVLMLENLLGAYNLILIPNNLEIPQKVAILT